MCIVCVGDIFCTYSSDLAAGSTKINVITQYNLLTTTVMDGVINGFSEMTPSEKKGLKDIIDSPLIRGLYTWSRGGGWWGPYIHGQEFW